MWEYWIAVCLVTNFSGEPVNKCYSKLGAEKYPREKICKAAAKAEDFRTYYTLRDAGFSGVPVIKTTCSEVTEKKGT